MFKNDKGECIGWIKFISRIYVFSLATPSFYGIQQLLAHKKDCFWDEKFFLGIGVFMLPIIIVVLALYGEKTGRWKLVFPYFGIQSIITVVLSFYNLVAFIALFYFFGKMYLDCDGHNRMNAGRDFWELLKAFLVLFPATLVNFVLGLWIFMLDMMTEDHRKNRSSDYSV